MAIPKRRVTDRASSTGRQPKAPRNAGPYAEGGNWARRVVEETGGGGSTMNLQLKKFVQPTGEHDPTKAEHFIVAGEPHPLTGERYPTIHVRMPGHMLSSAQWDQMTPETKALPPLSEEMVKDRVQTLIGHREMTGDKYGRQQGGASALGTWRVPTRNEDGSLSERAGQVDIDVSSAYRDRATADRLGEHRGEEAVFATNPMRNIPTVVGHALGQSYHPMDADLREEHAKQRGAA